MLIQRSASLIMEYKDFINELKVLSEEAKDLLNAEEYHVNPGFRKWRLKLTDLIGRINKYGYRFVCNVDKRTFGGALPTENLKIKFFNMELQDTINELELIIDNFRKYGPPKTEKIISKNTKELEWPDKITLNWLHKHAPISLWIKLVSILIAGFLFGITIGQSAFFKEIKEKITQSDSNTGDKSIKIVPNNRVHGTANSRRP